MLMYRGLRLRAEIGADNLSSRKVLNGIGHQIDSTLY